MPFDYSKAGVYGDAEWVKLAAGGRVSGGRVRPRSAAPAAAVGARRLRDAPRRRRGARRPGVRRAQGRRHGGDRRDGRGRASGASRWSTPRAWCTASTRTSSTSPTTPAARRGCAFDVRIEPGVVMYHEWRDDASPYRVGPSIWIQDGKLRAGGRQLVELPPGCGSTWRSRPAWASSRRARGTWPSRCPAGSPRSFAGWPTGAREWKKLDWLGFSSTANRKTVYYLDNIELDNWCPNTWGTFPSAG